MKFQKAKSKMRRLGFRILDFGVGIWPQQNKFWGCVLCVRLCALCALCGSKNLELGRDSEFFFNKGGLR